MKSFKDAVGVKPFYAELPKKEIKEVLGTEYVWEDARIVKGFRLEGGDTSNFVILKGKSIVKEGETPEEFTVLCGGSVVFEKVATAVSKRLFPLSGTIKEVEGKNKRPYYDIE